MWTPTTLNVASVLIALFLASAFMATLATVTTVALLLEFRAVWDKTFQASLAATAAATRQLAQCDTEIATLIAANAQKDIAIEELTTQLNERETSLAEAQKQMSNWRLYYERKHAGE